MNLDHYRKPLQPAPARIQALLSTGVTTGAYPADDSVGGILDTRESPAEGVWRADNGSALIVCTTEFPQATPAMLDWWFGWHLPSSERYRLWHPTAHIGLRVMEDRSHLPDDRARYLDNESYVDEYVGRKRKHLAIRFVMPQRFGLHGLDQRGATAICAITRDRRLRADGGHLCHLILPTATGCEMRSGFWLGDFRHQWRWVNTMFGGMINSGIARRGIINNRFCLDLLQHCSEEMTHLATFLPELYREMQAVA